MNETCNYLHLISGGLDSGYSLLKTAKEKKEKEPSVVIHPIFFDYGQFASETEWSSVVKIVEYIRDFLNEQSLIDDPVKISLKSELFQWSESDAFKGIEGNPNPEIGNRNLVLFSVLTSYLMACPNHQKIPKTGFSISSGFKEKELLDCSRDFFDKFTELLSMYKPEMKFYFGILENWNRQRVINETKVLLGSSEIELEKFLHLTISCYSPINGKPCGKCSKCKSLAVEKMKAHD